mmetsp:Transcript_11502/g.19710  ORF Transcript_11502/g.19710 Transcript_11502/m.19710 type:complete len:289 (-) Transcript_11502:163-1029(-)|eukprot:CAMPEP_0184691302 /NCGR_PEP_ID=MMETSP0313-20130426/195_1 /TAXON_ID=2792 /ORGANISM="Porphyridium aerugineum, Strain SAG 1380-2" /LENGTH=288 /DNA_ID=CAMNT_0027148989 /DNA_START=131 /DNA_END=997 /DNA_ORIENTATION=-
MDPSGYIPIDQITNHHVSQSQLTTLALLGLAFWFLGAVIIQFLGSHIFGHVKSLLTFLLTIPLAWFCVTFVSKVSSLTDEQLVSGIGIGLSVAMLADSVALTWIPWLYGQNPSHVVKGEAWLLFGVSMFTLASLYEKWRAKGGSGGVSESAEGVVNETGLNTKQAAYTVGWGLAFWFGGAVTCRYLGPLGIFGPWTSILSFVVAVPIIWFAVWLIIETSKLSSNQIVPAAALALASAVFCDSVCLTWARGMYGNDSEDVMLGAAWILWGGAITLPCAFYEEKRRSGGS